jgi:type VI secretion system protein ImpA
MSSVELWLQPLPDPDEPCGKDLEYDSDFLELVRVAQGKPETQFAPGEPPDWVDVLERSEALLGRTRDLRIALLWARASVNLRGFSALSPGLRLIEGLISNFWESLHPLRDPDDGDPYARANALAVLPDTEGLLGDLRQSVLFSVRGTGAIRVRSVLIALNQMGAKADETPLSRDQLAQMIATAVGENPALIDQAQAAMADVKSLISVLNERFGGEAAPDLRPIVELLRNVQSVMPAVVGDAQEANDTEAAESHSAGRSNAALGSVSSREDAVRAIDMICEYLDRTEPTNPAQLLLRRARRLINHNFLQLIKELAPEALNEAARVMGVDPDSVSLDSGF